MTPSIDKAVAKGVNVMCFDSDAPNSKRFAYYGTDDKACGQRTVDVLAKAMGEKGTIAILAGNQSAPNLQNRVAGAKEALAKYPNMKLNNPGVFYHVETPEKAAEAVQNAQNANPGIQGWAMIGGWPLFTADALKWPAGSIKVVAVDALPAQLIYVKNGYVEALLAQDCYGWGTKSLDILAQQDCQQSGSCGCEGDRSADAGDQGERGCLRGELEEVAQEVGEAQKPSSPQMSESFIQFKAITKTFGGVIALKDVSLEVARGECHGLMGENGAGKSTLGKVLAGIHKPDSGEMFIDGKLHSFNSPRDAMDAGVAMVHQELAFCRDLSVAENLSMGHYPRKLASDGGHGGNGASGERLA